MIQDCLMSMRWLANRRHLTAFASAIVLACGGIGIASAQDYYSAARPLPAVAGGETAALPSTSIEDRVQQLEQIIHQQAERQQELEQQLLHATTTNTASTYFIPDEVEEQSSLEKRLAEIEKDRAKEKEAAAKKKADEAKRTPWKWAGRIHTDYWAFPGTSPGANAFETGDAADSVNDRFLFRRIRFAVSGDIRDNMLYMVQFDFAHPDSPQIKDVYLGWKELPVLQTLLIGNQKRPYGFDQLNSSNNTIFLERPFVVDAFNQDFRRFGIQSYGVSEDLAWNWRYGTFLQQDLQNVGTVFTTPIAESYQGEIAGRLANTFWYDEASEGRGFGHWGIAGAFATPDGDAGSASTARFATRPEARTSSRWMDTGVIVGADSYELLALENVWNWGAWHFVGEYQQIWMQRHGGNPNVQFNGYYVEGAYFLTGEHMAWDRKLGMYTRLKVLENFFLVDTADDGVCAGWGAWQVAARYSHGDFTNQDIFGGVGDAMTLGLVWWWNSHARMSFNYIYGTIDDRAPVDGETDATYHIVGTRLQIDF
jgi:phosphate-selective porin OprO/OprP